MPLDAASSLLDAYYEASSPSLLAQQSATDDPPETPGRDWDAIYTHLQARLGSLKSWRYSWWSHWADLAANILPRRYKYLVVAGTFDRGNELNSQIVDDTATLAHQKCAAGLYSGLTAPSRPWFKLGPGGPWVQMDADASEWLEDTQHKIETVFHGSNFYPTMAQFFQDVSCFGTAPVILYEDHDRILQCYQPAAGEYYLAVNSKGECDTLYREFTMTVTALVDMFGIDNLPLEVVKLWQAGGASLQNELVVAHAIEPNFPLNGRGRSGPKDIRVVPGSFAFREVYWLRDRKTGRELTRRGFHDCPFIAGRWSRIANDAYGRSPGMDALGDIKQLQMETRRKGELLDKAVRPPMIATAEMANKPSSILPGAITYVSTGKAADGFHPAFEVNLGALSALSADIKEVQGRIKEAFFEDIFMAITQMEGVQPRNELEINKRDLERLQVLGPFINLFEVECAAPVIQRVLNILQRRRLLKPLPPSLQNVPLRVEVISMLALAQRAAENGEITSTVAAAAQMGEAAMQSGQPNPLDNIDMDEAIRALARNSNCPVKMIRDPKTVAANRAAKAQQMNAQNQAQVAAASAAPAATAAKTLSETDPTAGALGAMLGMGR